MSGWRSYDSSEWESHGSWSAARPAGEYSSAGWETQEGWETQPGWERQEGKRWEGKATDFSEHFNEGWWWGYNVGYRQGHRDGEREGIAKGWGKGWADCQEDPSWAEEYSSANGSGKQKKKGKKRAGAWNQWHKDYQAQDPVDMETYPRFQVWVDSGWSDLHEATNEKIRRHACDEETIRHNTEEEIDLGGDEGKYMIHIFEKPSEIDEVQEAIETMRRQKPWNWDWEKNVVGYQAPMGRRETKPRLRPVRIVRESDVREMELEKEAEVEHSGGQ